MSGHLPRKCCVSKDSVVCVFAKDSAFGMEVNCFPEAGLVAVSDKSYGDGEAHIIFASPSHRSSLRKSQCCKGHD